MYEVFISARGVLLRRPDNNEAVRSPRRFYIKDSDVGTFKNQFRMLSLVEDDDYTITKLTEAQTKEIESRESNQFSNVTGRTNRLSGTSPISLGNKMGNKTGV